MIKPLLIILLSSTCLLINSSLTNFGLKTTKGEALDLLELTTKAIVEGPYAKIEYIQTYKNPFSHPVETNFHFPRTESSIFHKFEAVFRNQTIVGKIFEKQTAKAMYDLNKERGNTVAYAERNQATPDIMNLKIGNIPSNETVQIIFSVIQPLEVIINKFFELKLPVVLTERYSSSSVNPNEVPDIKTVDTKASLYKEWNIQVELKSNTPFAILSNPTHHFKPTLSENPSGYNSTIYKASWNATVIPNKDFIVYFGPDKIQKPETILATHPQDANDHVLLVNFIPDLTTVETKDAQDLLETGSEGILKLQKSAYDYDVENAQAEFIFVIDRSGSMEGARIENLKRALVKFLNILPKKSYFNIMNFGSIYKLYNRRSLRNSPQARKEAIEWIEDLGADMGGTEILRPLQFLTRSENQNHDLPRIVMILTDGDVGYPDEVINHISQNANKMRFCSVGIGYGASEYLVKSIAKAGKCQSEFVLDDEDIGDKAMYLLKAAISQYVTDITFDAKCFNHQNQIVKQEEAQMDMLLKGQTFSKWIYLNNINNIQNCSVTFSYFNSLENKTVFEEMNILGYEAEEISDVWHKVAYDAKIRELKQINEGYDNENWIPPKLKAEIIKYSTKYQVLSDYTSFLAVVQENTVDPEATATTKINIPNLISADYSDQPQAQSDFDEEEDYDTFNADVDYFGNDDIVLNMNTNVEVSNLIVVNTDDFSDDCYSMNLDVDVDVDYDLDVSIGRPDFDSNDDDLYYFDKDVEPEVHVEGDVNSSCQESQAGSLVEANSDSCQISQVKNAEEKEETEEMSHLKFKQDPSSNLTQLKTDSSVEDPSLSLTKNFTQSMHSPNSTYALISDEKPSEMHKQDFKKNLSENSGSKIAGISLMITLLFALLL